jgi:LPXTG-motif cell wall-anchored protein
VTGTQYSFTVTAVDQYNNVATGYNGIVHFSSDDPQAVLPVDTALVNGMGSFTVTFSTPGAHTLTVVDLSNQTIASGSSPTIDVPTATTTPTTEVTPTMPAGGGLPATGTNSQSMIWLGLMFVICGGAILLLRTRRRHAGHTRM